MTNSKVLLTGTAGFIGMHTAFRLLEKGFQVTGLDVINDYYDVSLKQARLKRLGIDPETIQYGENTNGIQNFSFIKLDLSDAEGIKALFEFEKFDYVINLAAQAGVRYSLEYPEAYVNSNVTGFLNILEGCRHHSVKHLVYASTSSV